MRKLTLGVAAAAAVLTAAPAMAQIGYPGGPSGDAYGYTDSYRAYDYDQGPAWRGYHRWRERGRFVEPGWR
jgi:hypothetical protein